ncbi:preprotein translocase subunit SecA [bacterium]|nr:preprotein translocase subunit SecA [bacterium]
MDKLDLLKKIFGDRHAKEVKKLLPIVDQINNIYEDLHDLSDEELKGKTDEFRAIIAEKMDGFDRYVGIERDDPEREKKAKKNEVNYLQSTLDDLLPEAFAVVKDACRRLKESEYTFEAAGTKLTWDMIPFDVQLIGGIVLHEGKIAEMATGEGKTLVATLPLYLNALAGRGCHLITVNDYLAKRDAEWMGQVYNFLGLSIGCILGQMPPKVRKQEYGADITYGTNNEFGFDYLRDNLSVDAENLVQRDHHYAIIDEVDSVLIDEARTPLIIAGPVAQAQDGQDDFVKWNSSIGRLVKKQKEFVVQLVNEAEKLIAEADEGKASEGDPYFQAGIKLFQASRGAPKHKRVIKAFSESGRKKLSQDAEAVFIRDKKVHELDEVLYFVIDEKGHTIDLTDNGREELAKIERVDGDVFMLPDLGDIFADIDNDSSLSDHEKAERKSAAEIEVSARSSMLHSINQLLRAHSLYEKDEEYVLENGKVQIVDEFTGRIMYGRRYSDGLHQAIEAKEGVKIEAETQTIASITLQNYFRLYGKLAGMTGTAVTEEDEFAKIYDLSVSVIPTNVPIQRADEEDSIYRTQREKYSAIIQEIQRIHELGLPVLVGTTSVDSSELIARMLGSQTVMGKKLKDRIQILNAKQHDREADIVSQAGRPGAITIATNMAGRGTDIKIAPEVRDAHGEEGIITYRLKADPDLKQRHIEEHGIDPEDQPGGLQIIGSERHEARRIDRQLRGRSGRQGDPGRSKFYMSMEDDLMRLFGGDRMGAIMDRLGIQDGDVIAHPMVTKSLEKAQKRVEQHNFSIREHLLKYDDVMNLQREVVYARRHAALIGDIQHELENLLYEFIDVTIDTYCPQKEASYAWDWEGLESALFRTLLVDLHFKDEDKSDVSVEKIEELIFKLANEVFARRKETFGEEIYDKLLRYTILRVVDHEWMNHLYEMDRLKEGIGLRSYAQRDPLVEYKREGLAAFEQMLIRVSEQSLRNILVAKLRSSDEPMPARQPIGAAREMKSDASGMGLAERAAASASGQPQRPQEQPGARAGKKEPVKRVMPKVGRNDPCPCGSGKKFKQCHGR